MTSLVHPTPFTGDDYAARMVRVVHDAVAVGTVFSSRPDLTWSGWRGIADRDHRTPHDFGAAPGSYTDHGGSRARAA